FPTRRSSDLAGDPGSPAGSNLQHRTGSRLPAAAVSALRLHLSCLSDRSAAGNQPLPSDPRQLMNTAFQAFARRCLNYCKIKAVVGETGQGFIRTSKLDKQGAGLAVAPWPTLEMAQQRRLMIAREKDSWGGATQPVDDRAQRQACVGCVHSWIPPHLFCWAAVGGITGTSAL